MKPESGFYRAYFIMQGQRVTIVGRQAYKDVQLNPSERVYLSREPNNQDDSNAIAACKSNGDVFGHVRKTKARIMAHHMQLDDILKGIVVSGSSSEWRCTIQLD